jgi:hypothetical protein
MRKPWCFPRIANFFDAGETVERDGISGRYMLCSRGESCLSGIIHSFIKFIVPSDYND